MSKADHTYDLALLDRSYAKWQASSSLRVVYADIFAEMCRHLISGRSLEIGSGIGVSKEYFPDLITSDIAPTRFVDRSVSAYEIPRENWSNVIAMDMLHHLQEPLRFFQSASDALKRGGRIILAEPAATGWGRLFYGWFHHEPCLPGKVHPPFSFAADADGSFANMGIGYGMFVREKEYVAANLRSSGLRVTSVSYRDLLAYPASGGFSGRALLPVLGTRTVLALEHCLPQAVMRLLALRMIIVLEKHLPE